jgi:Tfp pilus assembly protein PilF
LHFWRNNLILLSSLLLGTSLLAQTASQTVASPKVSASEAAEVHPGKAYESLKQERYEDAAAEFRAALEIDPALVMRARFPTGDRAL